MVALDPNTNRRQSAGSTTGTTRLPQQASSLQASPAIAGVTVDLASLMRFEHRQQKTRGITNKVSKQNRRGDFRSLFKGKGMAFSEVRHYQPGDDVRTIDWHVTARRGGDPHTKLFEEERERPVYIVVDQRNHLFFGTQRCFKSVLACEIGALLAWQALAVGDRTSHLIFTDQQTFQHRPQAGKRGVLACLRALVEANQALHEGYKQKSSPGATQARVTGSTPAASTSALVNTLESISLLAKPGSYVVLISDFLGLSTPTHQEAVQHALRKLSEHTHSYGILIYDLLEASLPQAHRLDFTDGSKSCSLDSRSQATCTQYHAQFQNQLTRTQRLFKQSGLPLLLRGTHQETDLSLLSALHDPKWRQVDISESEQHLAQAILNKKPRATSSHDKKPWGRR